MSHSEWAPADGNAVSLPTIVSSSDLFDGELFGDELIDIYNNTVDHGDSVHHDMANLLSSDGTEHHHRTEDDHADDILAAIDEGFASFRPSSSFNDLTNLLTPSTIEVAMETEASVTPPPEAHVAVAPPVAAEPAVHVAAAPVAPVTAAPAPPASQPPVATAVVSIQAPAPAAPVVSADASAANTKKRVGEPLPSAPAAKKKSAGPRRVSVTKKSPAPPQPMHDGKKTDDKKNTPNPLTLAASAQPPSPEATTASPVGAPTAVVVVPKVGGVTHNVTVTKESVPASTSVTSSVSKSVSESDFKSIAQAAVSNLIMNVNTESEKDKDADEAVDTSTAHIKALTGNNWVAACAGAAIGVTSSNNSTGDDSKSNNRARRQNLTPDERARQNRDRNREHARNTRLRKKAYVEELKRTLTELVAQRDAADLEKRQSAQRELEQREVRFRVLEEFLKLRGRNEPNFARWAAILEDGFVLTAPSTDVRKLQEGSLPPGHEQVLKGVSHVMADSSLFSSFLHSLGNGEGSVVFHHRCERKNFFMDGCTAVLEWSGSSTGAVGKGASSEFPLKGSIRARFSPASNKLMSAAIAFDTSAMLMQSNQSSLRVQYHSTSESNYDVVAAQAAASTADAILDSLQMPTISGAVPAAVTIVHNSSDGSSLEKGLDSDESVGEQNTKAIRAHATIHSTPIDVKSS